MEPTSSSVEPRIPSWLIDPRMVANIYRLMFVLFVCVAIFGTVTAFLGMHSMKAEGGAQMASHLGRLLFIVVLFCIAFCAILFFSAPSREFLNDHSTRGDMLKTPARNAENKKQRYDPATNIDNWDIMSRNPAEKSRIAVAEDGLNYMRQRRKKLENQLEMKARADMMRRFRAE